MDVAMCVICLLCCLFYGYNAQNDTENATLVLSDIACHENNNYKIPFKFEPVNYIDVSDLENHIMKLLTNGDTVRLADYGLIRYSQSLKCYKLAENPENKKQVSAIKTKINSAKKDPEHSLQKVLKRESNFIGYEPSLCVFVPLSASELISCFEESNPMNCASYRNRNITIPSSEIYLYIKAYDLMRGSNSLCSYTDIAPIIEKRFSPCDLSNHGALCLYINGVTTAFLDLYITPNNNTMCTSLTRDVDRLFVNTTSCNTEMESICRKVPYNYTIPNTPLGTSDHTMKIALTSVGVSLVIILVSVLVVLIVRRYFTRDSGTSTVGTQLVVDEVVDRVPEADSVSIGTGAVDNDSYAGAVPGRGGADNDDGTDNDDSYGGAVPGRGGTFDNNSYGGSVDDDSCAGEVHGRTASGHINAYSNYQPNK